MLHLEILSWENAMNILVWSTGGDRKYSPPPSKYYCESEPWETPPSSEDMASMEVDKGYVDAGVAWHSVGSEYTLIKSAKAKKCFRLCNGNFGFLDDLIFVWVSETNGILGSVCRLLSSCLMCSQHSNSLQFDSTAFQQRFWCMKFMDWDNYLSLMLRIQDLKLCCSLWWYCVDFEFLKRVARARLLRRFNCGCRQCCSAPVITAEDQVW